MHVFRTSGESFCWDLQPKEKHGDRRKMNETTNSTNPKHPTEPEKLQLSTSPPLTKQTSSGDWKPLGATPPTLLLGRSLGIKGHHRQSRPNGRLGRSNWGCSLPGPRSWESNVLKPPVSEKESYRKRMT